MAVVVSLLVKSSDGR